MQSIVDGHFPQIRFKKRTKFLWNPIHKKTLKNRPEERVRLRVVEYLLQAGQSKHRISTEERITSGSVFSGKSSGHGRQAKKGTLRTDLICYTQDFEPLLLTECKAPRVNISEETAEQIARYNKRVSAPYLLITNGRTDLWYSFKNRDEPELQAEIPKSFLGEESNTERTFTYWSDRGFAGKKAAPKLRKWLHANLNTFVDDRQSELRYLSFEKKLYDLDANQYYVVYNFNDSRIALAFTATAFGGSRLIAVKNENGKNEAVLVVNFDLLFDGQAPNASIYGSDIKKNVDITEEMSWEADTFEPEDFAEKVLELL